MIKSCDYLIIGGGILGLTVANELINRGLTNIIIIEKENEIGKHASGRNSGVLHSGIYYSSESLKAKHCVEGNRLMKEFCIENNIKISNCGKVIVADSAEKLNGLKELKKRADKNGVKSKIISSQELKDIEPNAFTYKEAIYSPDTSVFNPIEILNALKEKFIKTKNCGLLLNTEFISNSEKFLASTTKGKINYNLLINAAGAYAEKIAHLYNLGLNYRSIPFLGTYKELSKKSTHLVNGNIYPVPDIRNPFLGVHLTKAVNGKVYIGPTAIPVFGRESYKFFQDLSIESFSFIYRDILMFLKSDPFRTNAISEIKKYLGKFVYLEAKKLIPDLKPHDVMKSEKAGIRAQLVDWDKKELVMDYVVENGKDSIHILNAVSPA
ncbi:MAG: L-2-hydroxyglutarate oxidase, partial [Thermodesulfobacteriota bacterium]